MHGPQEGGDVALEVLSIILFVSYHHPAYLICFPYPDLPFSVTSSFSGSLFLSPCEYIPCPIEMAPHLGKTGILYWIK